MTGTWLYAGSVPCEVRIVQHDILYGTGDYQDPPHIANDREVECFYVLFQTPTGEPSWVGGGVALSVNDAVALAESKLAGGVNWNQ
ncbi:MAG: hypothetical protein JNK75_01195 [Betaproteobacteria bacterium]|nr:hypothetical protein [Betaproteobacteria bacterium]